MHRIGKYFVINEGELHGCLRFAFWRMRNNIISKVKGECVPLMDSQITIEQKRRCLMEIYEKKTALPVLSVSD